jgi:hypothetical protein
MSLRRRRTSVKRGYASRNVVTPPCIPRTMPRTFGEFAVFAAPAVFLLLWAILAVIIAVTKPKWPNRAGLVHSAAAGFMVEDFIAAQAWL